MSQFQATMPQEGPNAPVLHGLSCLSSKPPGGRTMHTALLKLRPTAIAMALAILPILSATAGVLALPHG